MVCELTQLSRVFKAKQHLGLVLSYYAYDIVSSGTERRLTQWSQNKRLVAFLVPLSKGCAIFPHCMYADAPFTTVEFRKPKQAPGYCNRISCCTATQYGRIILCHTYYAKLHKII